MKFKEWIKLKEQMMPQNMTGIKTISKDPTTELLKKIASNQTANPNVLKKQINQAQGQIKSAAAKASQDAKLAAMRGDAAETFKQSMNAASLRAASSSGAK